MSLTRTIRSITSFRTLQGVVAAGKKRIISFDSFAKFAKTPTQTQTLSSFISGNTNSNRQFSVGSVVCQKDETPEKSPLFFVEEQKGFVVFKMNKPPVNTLSLEFLTELNIQLEKIEQNKAMKGVILTSNFSHLFSAGLDIMEMYQCKEDRLRQFWTALQDFWLRLYGSNKVYIAAVNGHAPAGGCLMAMSCDYRIMAKGPYKMGLNETLLGIKSPFWFMDTMINTIGHRETEKALQLGKLYSPEEALAINMVDELCEPNELMDKAQEQMKQWCRIPTVARTLTKADMRKETMNRLLSRRSEDVDDFVNFITREPIQKAMGMYLESLKKPKAAKK